MTEIRLFRYKWTQTLEEIDLRVPLPMALKGKDLIVDIGKKHLKVRNLRSCRCSYWVYDIKIQMLGPQNISIPLFLQVAIKGKPEAIIDGEFLHDVKVDECAWTLEDKR